MVGSQLAELRQDEHQVGAVRPAARDPSLQLLSDERQSLERGVFVERVDQWLDQVRQSKQILGQGAGTADDNQSELARRALGDERRQERAEYRVCSLPKWCSYQHVAERIPVGGEDLSIGEQPQSQ